jgi:hypothetical protein
MGSNATYGSGALSTDAGMAAKFRLSASSLTLEIIPTGMMDSKEYQDRDRGKIW